MWEDEMYRQSRVRNLGRLLKFTWLYFDCVYVCMCLGMCMWVQVSVVSKESVGSPVSAGKGVCGFPLWVTGSKLGSSDETTCLKRWAITPGPSY